MNTFNRKISKVEKTESSSLLNLKKANFLIIEESSDSIQKLKLDLSHLGFCGRIFCAQDLSSAMRLFEKEDINIVVTEWLVADGDALGFLKYIRKNQEYRHIPFIMCTEEDDVTKMLKAVQSGVSEYIVKPWDRKTLLSKLKISWEDSEKEKFRN